MYDQPLTIVHTCAVADSGTFTRRIKGPAGASGVIREIIFVGRAAITSGAVYISDSNNTDGAYVNNWQPRPAADEQEQFPQDMGAGSIINNREIEQDAEIRVHSTIGQSHDIHVVIDWNALIPKPRKGAG